LFNIAVAQLQAPLRNPKIVVYLVVGSPEFGVACPQQFALGGGPAGAGFYLDEMFFLFAPAAAPGSK